MQSSFILLRAVSTMSPSVIASLRSSLRFKAPCGTKLLRVLQVVFFLLHNLMIVAFQMIDCHFSSVIVHVSQLFSFFINRVNLGRKKKKKEKKKPSNKEYMVRKRIFAIAVCF